MVCEYTAPAVLNRMQDMIGEAGRLLSPCGNAKSRADAIELASRGRLTSGRVKRLLYEEVKTVPKQEYDWLHDWLNILRGRLGDLEKRYSAARKALLERSGGDPLVARLVAPAIGAPADRQITDAERRATVAVLRDAERKARWRA